VKVKTEITHPDRVIFPDTGFTKRDLVEHYARVADRMLPHVEGRPLTLQRFPRGIGEDGFMQKNAGEHFPGFIHRERIEHQSGTTEYALVDSAEGLTYLANQGTVTFHVWTSKKPHLDMPDRIVFDLDPPDGGYEAARKGAKHVREVLDELSLPSCPMVTGSEGYHVVCPIEARHRMSEVGRFARIVAETLAARHDDTLTSEFRKSKREGRVFVDWLRNRDAQTVVAPWSLRPRKGAPVAVPIGWDEIDDTPPDRWKLDDMEERIGRDPLIDTRPAVLDEALATAETMAEEADLELKPFDRFRS
jgi:bifunctional non-homologous end joining protein LigD